MMVLLVSDSEYLAKGIRQRVPAPGLDPPGSLEGESGTIARGGGTAK